MNQLMLTPVTPLDNISHVSNTPPRVLHKRSRIDYESPLRLPHRRRGGFIKKLIFDNSPPAQARKRSRSENNLISLAIYHSIRHALRNNDGGSVRASIDDAVNEALNAPPIKNILALPSK